MRWLDITSESMETDDSIWRAEQRNGLWWVYRNEKHVATQFSKEDVKRAAKRIAERIAERGNE